MNMQNAQRDLDYIKSMINETRQITAGSWMFFLFWGIMVIIGVAGMYGLIYLKRYELIFWNWIAVTSIGVLFTLIYGRKIEKKSGVKTYANMAVGHIGMASGISFILVGFIFPLLHVYGWEQIPVLISLVAGFMVFSMGGIFEWNLLKWCGVAWWIGALVMALIQPEFRTLLFIPLILIGYILPAWRLRTIYYMEGQSHEQR
ncbi:MAG: hypothetical protein Kow00108_10740 [Calditrichia bacterium]